MDTLYTLRAIIADERRCLHLFRDLRWEGRVTCVHCGSRRVRQRDWWWRCRDCDRRFSVMSGTIFHKSKLLLSQIVWVVGMLELTTSSREIARMIGVQVNSVSGLVRKIGMTLGGAQLSAKLRGNIELDDAFFGGKRKGKRGRGAAGKTPMLGLKTRTGKARILAVPHLRNPRLRRTIRAQAAQRSRFITDKLGAYGKLRNDGFRHWRIDHGERFRVGEKHTQGVEGMWGHVKPRMFAAHRHLSPEHLQAYLNLQTWKFGRQKPPNFLLDTLRVLLQHRQSTT